MLAPTMAAAPAGAATVCRGYWFWCRRLRCQRPGELGMPVTNVPGAVAAGCTVHCSPAVAGADTHTLLLVGTGVLLLTTEVVVTGECQPMLSAAASDGVWEGDSRNNNMRGVGHSGCMYHADTCQGAARSHACTAHGDAAGSAAAVHAVPLVTLWWWCCCWPQPQSMLAPGAPNTTHLLLTIAEHTSR